MKKLMFILAIAFSLGACSDEKVGWGNDVDTTKDVGYINFGESGVVVNVEQENASGEIDPQSSTRADDAATTPDDAQYADYTIEIWSDGGETPMTTFKYGERESQYTTSSLSGAKGVAVPVGTYIVKAYSAQTPEASTTPQYAGQTMVTVTKEQEAKAEINCKLSSVMVSVRFDPILASLITDETQSRMVLGSETTSTHTFTGRPVTPDTQVELAAGLAKMDWYAEGGFIYLRPNEETNPLNLYLTTTYNGNSIKDQALKVCDDAKAGEWRKITVKLENGDSGTVYIVVNVQTWVNGEVVDVDVTKMSLFVGEAEIPDSSDAPMIEWADHDLSQSFTITDQMFNSAGAYTEGATFKVKTKTPITSFKLELTTDNSELLEAATDMGLKAEGGIDLVGSLSTTTKMILGSWGFPTANIEGESSLEFDLSALMKELHTNYAGNHEFKMTVADSNSSSTTVSLKITSGIVIDPNIVWVGYNIDKRYDIYPTEDDPTTMAIRVTAKSGIKSLVVTILGPLVEKNETTGNSLLDEVMMPNSFDLVAPGETLDGEDLAVKLNGLGFPTGDDVKDKTSLDFDITGFKGMLKVAPGHTDFKLTLTDNDGNVIEKSMMINMIVE